MSDRSNRVIVTAVGLILLVGGTLSACLGAGAFGTARSNRDVIDSTLIGWWDEGGWKSFAVLTAIGAIGVGLGALLTVSQLHRNDGRRATPDFAFPPTEGARGATTLCSPALSHHLEADIEAIPDVERARVGLFGRYPNIEMRAVISVDDNIDLERLPTEVDAVLGRMATTTGTRPDPVQITIRFRAAAKERKLT